MRCESSIAHRAELPGEAQLVQQGCAFPGQGDRAFFGGPLDLVLLLAPGCLSLLRYPLPQSRVFPELPACEVSHNQPACETRMQSASARVST